MFLTNSQVLIASLFFAAPIFSIALSQDGVGLAGTPFGGVSHDAERMVRSAALRRRSPIGGENNIQPLSHPLPARSSSPQPAINSMENANTLRSMALATSRDLHLRTISTLKARDPSSAPRLFEYCLASGAKKLKRAEDTTVPPGTTDPGCGCITFTGVLWHGLVFGVGKFFRGVGKCVGNCCAGSGRYEFSHQPVVEFR